MNIVGDALIKMHNLPDGFAFYGWEHLQSEPELTRFTGGMCSERQLKKPHLTLLRHKDWKKRDKSKDRTFYVTKEQAEQFEREYIEQTGCCPRCEGKKVVMQSCGVLKALPFRDDGEGSYSTYRTCGKCKGTGKATAGLAVLA